MFTFSEYEGIFQLKNKCEIKKKKGENPFLVSVCVHRFVTEWCFTA